MTRAEVQHRVRIEGRDPFSKEVTSAFAVVREHQACAEPDDRSRSEFARLLVPRFETPSLARQREGTVVLTGFESGSAVLPQSLRCGFLLWRQEGEQNGQGGDQ